MSLPRSSSILSLPSAKDFTGYVIFVWVYGIFHGGYHYALKMYIYEKARARNFAKAWSFVQCSAAIPNCLGVPIVGYINVGFGTKAGYYLSATCVLIGSVTLFLIDVHKRTMQKKSRHKVEETLTQVAPTAAVMVPTVRKDSLTGDDFLPSKVFLKTQRSFEYGNLVELNKHLWASGDGVGVPDDILLELENLDNITSCNKVIQTRDFFGQMHLSTLSS